VIQKIGQKGGDGLTMFDPTKADRSSFQWDGRRCGARSTRTCRWGWTAA